MSLHDECIAPSEDYRTDSLGNEVRFVNGIEDTIPHGTPRKVYQFIVLNAGDAEIHFSPIYSIEGRRERIANMRAYFAKHPEQIGTGSKYLGVPSEKWSEL